MGLYMAGQDSSRSRYYGNALRTAKGRRAHICRWMDTRHRPSGSGLAMANIVTACIVMVYIVMAYTVMAYKVMACKVMVYVDMVCVLFWPPGTTLQVVAWPRWSI